MEVGAVIIVGQGIRTGAATAMAWRVDPRARRALDELRPDPANARWVGDAEVQDTDATGHDKGY